MSLTDVTSGYPRWKNPQAVKFTEGLAVTYKYNLSCENVNDIYGRRVETNEIKNLAWMNAK